MNYEEKKNGLAGEANDNDNLRLIVLEKLMRTKKQQQHVLLAVESQLMLFFS